MKSFDFFHFRFQSLGCHLLSDLRLNFSGLRFHIFSSFSITEIIDNDLILFHKLNFEANIHLVGPRVILILRYLN